MVASPAEIPSACQTSIGLRHNLIEFPCARSPEPYMSSFTLHGGTPEAAQGGMELLLGFRVEGLGFEHWRVEGCRVLGVSVAADKPFSFKRIMG